MLAWSGEAAALVGRSLGEFVVREQMSRGGFGLVFRAEQPGLGREAVIKVLQDRMARDEATAQRFLREAQLASRLDHPYAAHVYAFGAEPDGVLWIAMEMVRGAPLELLLRTQGPIPLERFVPLLERICEVVHTAHEQGVIHRDLKPANVMVLSRAGRLLPKLLDFGVAKLHGDAASAGTMAELDGATLLDDTQPVALEGDDTLSAASRSLTGARTTLGSPHYMAPEQWRNASAADVRSDTYALGILAYEALTGRRPFVGDTVFQLFTAHEGQAPPSLGAGFPPGLDAVLTRAMAKEPAARYASALELAEAFRRASGITAEPTLVPRLDEAVRVRALAFAPRPLAQAIAALDAARNPHQARDALATAARVMTRWVALLALASHAHVGTSTTVAAGVRDALRRLREPNLSDAEWLELARVLVRPFEALRDAHPLPELVGFLTGGAAASLDGLVALDRSGGSEEQVRDQLARALPGCGQALEALRFLASYPLWIPDEDGAEEWMGLSAARRLPPPGRALPAGRPVLVDADGVPVVALWPFVQLHEPTPSAPPALFLHDGKGRRGARLVALPDLFEREDLELWEALGGLVGEVTSGATSDSLEETSPFPGLAPFTEERADDFFGRERECEAFLNRLRVTPLLAVVGPSGAGKSSFIRAGVVPGLPDGWSTILLRPGARPIDALSARLSAVGLDAARLAQDLADTPSALGYLVRSWAQSRRTTVVLIVDQLEEIFTLCGDPGERELFAEALARAARSPDDPVRIVLTMRDDFLLRADAVPAFRTRLTHGLQLLATPAPPDLRRILVEPLRRAGYQLDDPGLPDEIVEAVASRAGALPLLAFTAARLWELRDRRFRQIGYKAYRSLGGVAGALSQHAEATLLAMPPEEQRLVREVFRHAVTAHGTRAVLSRAELDQRLGGGAHAGQVVDKLVDARLLVVAEGETGGEQIEIIHEALLEAWPRLVGWRREDAEGARMRDQLRAASRQWDERGRRTGLLWRGDALEEYRLWRARYGGALTEVEQAFGDASLGDAARARALRRWSILGAFVAVLAVGVALFMQNRTVERQRARAIASTALVNRHLLDQYISQARRLVLAEDHLQALAYLDRAIQLGARGPAIDLMIAQAVRATDGLELELRHDNSIARVRYAPDGTRIATAGYDRQARLWDARTGAVVATLEHADGVLRIELSRDGQRVATGSLDRTAAIWSAADGARLHTLEHEAPVQAVQFSPDGELLATVTVRDAVRLWNVRSGQLVASLQAPGESNPRPAGSVAAFSPAGDLLAVGGQDGQIRIWRPDDPRPRPPLRGHTQPVTTVQFSGDGGALLSASLDGAAVVWNPASGRALARVSHEGPINAAVFSPDGTRFATASGDRTAMIWDARSGAPRSSPLRHAGAVNRAAYSPDGSRLATVSDDGSIALWDPVDGRRLAHRQGHIGSLYDIAFSPDGKHMAASSSDGGVLVWDARPVMRTTVLRGSGHTVHRAVFSPSGTHAVTTGEGVATVWDATTGRAVHALRGHALGLLTVRFDPSGEEVATGDAEGVVRRWDLRTGDLLASFRAHEGGIIELAWHRSGEQILTAGQDGTAALWQATSGRLIRRLQPHDGFPLNGAAFAPDGRSFATSGEDNTVRRFAVATGRLLSRIDEPDGAYALAFAPDGSALVVATGRRSAVIRALATGEVRARMDDHPGIVTSAQLSPDGQMVVTGGSDGAARVWEARTGNLLAVLTQSSRALWWTEWASDGRRVISASEDGDAIIWELPSYGGSAADLARLVRCRVPYEVDGDRLRHRATDRAACR